MARTWTCQKQSKGVRCGHVNPKIKHICEQCGKRRLPSKKLAHRRVLEVFPYECWVVFFGERCGICGAEPEDGKKLMRDHDHRVEPDDPSGGMRGLLCFRCNRQLPTWATVTWMVGATDYLKRATEHLGS